MHLGGRWGSAGLANNNQACLLQTTPEHGGLLYSAAASQASFCASSEFGSIWLKNVRRIQRCGWLQADRALLKTSSRAPDCEAYS